MDKLGLHAPREVAMWNSDGHLSYTALREVFFPNAVPLPCGVHIRRGALKSFAGPRPTPAPRDARLALAVLPLVVLYHMFLYPVHAIEDDAPSTRSSKRVERLSTTRLPTSAEETRMNVMTDYKAGFAT